MRLLSLHAVPVLDSIQQFFFRLLSGHGALLFECSSRVTFESRLLAILGTIPSSENASDNQKPFFQGGKKCFVFTAVLRTQTGRGSATVAGNLWGALRRRASSIRWGVVAAAVTLLLLLVASTIHFFRNPATDTPKEPPPATAAAAAPELLPIARTLVPRTETVVRSRGREEQ